MQNQSLSQRLADWLIEMRSGGFPERTLRVAQIYVLDWIGCALAGTNTEPGSKLINYAQDQPDGPCLMIGTGRGGSPEAAALINGGLSHIVEMDDLDGGSVTHPGAVIIPAALATATWCGAGGANFLSAVVAGYEVGIRIGESVGKRHYFYFHNTATCGVFGAVAAVSWLLDLDPVQTADGLGNAGTLAAGLWEFNTDGAMSKHLHAGRAASNGVLAGLLARHGFSGARNILEGRRGFFAAMAPNAKPERVVEGLNAPQTAYKIERVSLKPHASCRHTHPAIDATLQLRNQVGVRETEVIQVKTYQAALDLCDNPQPRTPYEAKFSLQYCVATALANGSAGVDDFSVSAISDPALAALLPKITLKLDKAYESRYPTEWPTSVSIQLRNGGILGAEIRHPKGSPENPLTSREVEEKFYQLATFSGFESQAGTLVEWVDSLPRAPRVNLEIMGIG